MERAKAKAKATRQANTWRSGAATTLFWEAGESSRQGFFPPPEEPQKGIPYNTEFYQNRRSPPDSGGSGSDDSNGATSGMHWRGSFGQRISKGFKGHSKMIWALKRKKKPAKIQVWRVKQASSRNTAMAINRPAIQRAIPQQQPQKITAAFNEGGIFQIGVGKQICIQVQIPGLINTTLPRLINILQIYYAKATGVEKRVQKRDGLAEGINGTAETWGTVMDQTTGMAHPYGQVPTDGLNFGPARIAGPQEKISAQPRPTILTELVGLETTVDAGPKEVVDTGPQNMAQSTAPKEGMTAGPKEVITAGPKIMDAAGPKEAVEFGPKETTVARLGTSTRVAGPATAIDVGPNLQASEELCRTQNGTASPHQADTHILEEYPNGPPGFEGAYFSQTDIAFEMEANRTTEQVRRSKRLQAKESGAYISVLEKASRLKGGNQAVLKPMRSERSKPMRQPDFRYLESLSPLTAPQAELVIYTAGVEIDEAMSDRIEQIVTTGDRATAA
ncbi:hypothetical protein FCM35_KLT17268 [Carex littledalei]|uniref:Uncharacterized protein n=1 Tax=Carex littledalei TaxID=544730 RepID=A0A833RFY6_9POAL|nr:hypothetical protein FCM35_KLT17268 [Carex littledalei]